MVIFGAGASYDSSATYGMGAGPPDATEIDAFNEYYRLPLAKDLFANRPLFIDAIDEFPQCKTIVPRLRNPDVISGRESIEALLQEIEKESHTYSRGQRELFAIRCYLQRAIALCEMKCQQTTRGITNHLRLLREIERTQTEPVCLVTFNYDTLLEVALGQLGQNFGRMEDYAAKDGFFRLFKLHGSVHWARKVRIEIPNPYLGIPLGILRYLIDRADELSLSDRVVFCHPTTMGAVDGTPVFPAIAIPVEKKQVFECPKEMIDELTTILPRVTKVVVIGWRATEDHFTDPLRQHLRVAIPMYVVAGRKDWAEGVAAQILRKLTNKRLVVSPEAWGFSDFMREGRGEEILRPDNSPIGSLE
jgi:hypothetical protein